LTTVLAELTEAELPSPQLPLVKINGVMGLLALQLLATVMLTAVDVLAA
jgi:hypothetical protein